LNHPPLTQAFSPLALLYPPPLTEEYRPPAVLPQPPLIEAALALVVFSRIAVVSMCHGSSGCVVRIPSFGFDGA
jgi:hypothetical protein